MTQEELDFLRESNNIEDEWDDKSLQDAILAWEYLKTAKRLTLPVILKTHSLLMRSRDTIENVDKGRFRDGPVWIAGKEAKPWYVIENLLEKWCNAANYILLGKQVEKTKYNIGKQKEYIKEDHIQYEKIHPFFDGNGRTGRLFYNWYRVKMGLPIEIIWEKKKQDYYKWFEGVGVVGDPSYKGPKKHE